MRWWPKPHAWQSPRERNHWEMVRVAVARDLLQMAPDLARINPDAGWAAVATAARILTASLESRV